MDTPLHAVSDRIGPGSVSVTRTGDRTYHGMNERGDGVLIGPPEAPGHFTPGELLKLALAGCAGMSSDRVTARRLGPDYSITIWAHGASDPAEQRYSAIDEELLLDLSALDEAERSTLIQLMAKSIDRSCTVARTVGPAIDLTTSIDGSPIH